MVATSREQKKDHNKFLRNAPLGYMELVVLRATLSSRAEVPVKHAATVTSDVNPRREGGSSLKVVKNKSWRACPKIKDGAHM